MKQKTIPIPTMIKVSGEVILSATETEDTALP
jgi:hypothetical protein